MENGYYTDDGDKIDFESIPIPSLCLSCLCRQENEVACNLTRADQVNGLKHGELFCCFAYKPNDPTIDIEPIFKEMDEYLANKNSVDRQFRKIIRNIRHDRP